MSAQSSAVKSEVNPYDEVPYGSYAFAQTHPDRLATIAALFHLKPLPVERCRILELGCADGGNLIPMALGLPAATCLGIDAARSAIATGEATIRALGLPNITLRALDILEVGPELGEFDYIIAHGIYSWVPAPVRDGILAVSKGNLAPNGVAYVSYNAYPGCHLRNLMRDMMRFHAGNFTDPAEVTGQARAFAKFLKDSQADSSAYGALLEAEVQRILKYPDVALYHDDLSETNTASYFYQFVEHARRYGLKYLGEADFFEMCDYGFPPEVRDTLAGLGNHNIVRKEQYMDFLKCRRFRQTLLCHQEAPLDRSIKPEDMRAFYVASSARPTSEDPDIRTTASEEFRNSHGICLSITEPISKAALLHLGRLWPQSQPFPEVLAAARSAVGACSDLEGENAPDEASLLGESVFRLYAAGFLELHVYAPRFAAGVSERPVASPVARLQAQTGDIVASLRHTRVQLKGAVARRLLQLLDGSRDRAALLAAITGVPREEAAGDAGGSEQLTETNLEEMLVSFARSALLVA